jgi:3'-5' exoribonuclease Rv2179c-like domain
MHVMLDLETLGTKPGCAIVSIGACIFDIDGVHDTFYRAINVATKFGSKSLAIDPGTVVWWMAQSPEARAVFFDPAGVSTYDALVDFKNWWKAKAPLNLHDGDFIWCHGATFDAPILEAAYNAIEDIPPFKFYNVRDTRTLYSLAGVSVDRAKGTHHNALDDAVAQAVAVIKAYGILDRTL